MDFRGEHALLIFHSDISGDNWVENHNNWGGNVYMHVKSPHKSRNHRITKVPLDLLFYKKP